MKIGILIPIVYSLTLVGCLDFEPRDRQIHIFENDGYTIGFSYHERINKCTYKNNKGIDSFFTVDRLKDNDADEDDKTDGDPNEVIEMGTASLCAIRVLNVTLDGATSWTITAQEGQTVLEEVTVQVTIVSDNTLRHTPHSQQVYVAEGGDYIVGFWHNKAIKICYFETSTGYNKTYIVKQPKRIREEHELNTNSTRHNVLYAYPPVGMCKVHVDGATADGPLWIKLSVGGYIRTDISTLTFDINVITKESLEFVPYPPFLWATDGGEYAFGFSHHLGISKCIVESHGAEPRQFSFEVTDINTDRDSEYVINANELYDFSQGANSLCKVRVRSANLNIESWTITASDGRNNISTEHVVVNTFEPEKLLTSSIYVHSGATFAQSIVKVYPNIVQCTLHSVNNTIYFNDRTEGNNAGPSDNPIAKKVIPWNYGTCGFKFVNIDENSILSNLQWNLIAKDSQGKVIGNNFDVHFVPYEKETLHEVVLGESYLVRCSYHYQEFCELYNPAGTLVRRAFLCDYRIMAVSLDDIGEWKCISSLDGSMKSVEYSIVLKRIDMGLYSLAKQEEDYVVLTCGFTKEAWIDACQMISPANVRYILNPHLASKRHTAIGTSFEKSKCVMQIKKPLQANEKGLWKCEINAGDQIFGSIIEVDVDHEKIPAIEKYSKRKFRAFESFLLIWDVSFSSPNCYIQSPAGDVFSSDQPYQSTLGRCTLTVPSNYTAKQGNWTCYFAQPNIEENIEVVIDVTIDDVSPPNSYIQVDEGQPLTMLYFSGGEPIKHCIFISPTNESYYIRNNQQSDTMKYKGKGLEFGECGIEISKTSASDYGIWQCFSKIALVSMEQNASARFWVIDSKTEPPNFERIAASSISFQSLASGEVRSASDIAAESNTWITRIEITVGLIALIALIFGGVFAYRRWRPQPVFVGNRNNEAVNMTFFNAEQAVQTNS